MGSDVPAGLAIELCSSKGAYEVTPSDDLGLDLASARETFEEQGLSIVTDAGVLLVVDAVDCEVSVFESGRLLAKTDDRDVAEAVTRRVYDALEVEP
jgi:hypothetical protein